MIELILLGAAVVALLYAATVLHKLEQVSTLHGGLLLGNFVITIFVFALFLEGVGGISLFSSAMMQELLLLLVSVCFFLAVFSKRG